MEEQFEDRGNFTETVAEPPRTPFRTRVIQRIQSQSNLGWVILIVVLLLIAGGVGVGIWLWRRNANKKKKKCRPGDPVKNEFTRRVQDEDGEYVCPVGFADTGCTFEDGPELGERQCQRQQQQQQPPVIQPQPSQPQPSQPQPSQPPPTQPPPTQPPVTQPQEQPPSQPPSQPAPVPIKPLCTPGSDLRFTFSRKVYNDGVWVCPIGYEATGCTWEDGPILGEKQCRTVKKMCLPGDPKNSQYTTRVQQGAGWVCPAGFTDTNCTWTDGLEYGKLQCRKPKTNVPNVPNVPPTRPVVTPVPFQKICRPGIPKNWEYTVRVQQGTGWVCPAGFTDTNCNWTDGPEKGKLQCRKPKTKIPVVIAPPTGPPPSQQPTPITGTTPTVAPVTPKPIPVIPSAPVIPPAPRPPAPVIPPAPRPPAPRPPAPVIPPAPRPPAPRPPAPRPPVPRPPAPKTCSPGKKFDTSKNRCVNKCPSGQKYSASKNKCVIKCPSGKKYSASKNKCVDKNNNGGRDRSAPANAGGGIVTGTVSMPPQGGCPPGWSKAVGTLYDLWPKPGTTECIKYSGCRWAGQTKALDPGPENGPCKPGAKILDGGNGDKVCRWPEEKIKEWSIASTWEKHPELANKVLEVAVEGGNGRTVRVNMKDVCADPDCDNCCSKNTGNGKWPLIDMEKHPAAALLGFDFSASDFDINKVNFPDAKGKRPGAPEDAVLPFCYKEVI